VSVRYQERLRPARTVVGERLAERGQGVRRGLGRHRPAVAKVVGVEARVQVVDVDPTARAGAAQSATARGAATARRRQ